MAILNFQKPDKVIMIDSTDFQGRFEFRPLEPGFGLTVGNALRRVLLSSLEGFAITSLRIEGIEHEFSTIKGVVEDVTEIILNLKQVRFKKQIEDSDRETVNVSISNQEQLTAGDLQKYISGFQVLNHDLVICNMEKSVSLDFEITIEKGRGFVPAEENKKSGVALGTIFTDSIYTPIQIVSYEVANMRVGQRTDFDQLRISIDTDGTISPREALTRAGEILVKQFAVFTDAKNAKKEEGLEVNGLRLVEADFVNGQITSSIDCTNKPFNSSLRLNLQALSIFIFKALQSAFLVSIGKYLQ